MNFEDVIFILISILTNYSICVRRNYICHSLLLKKIIENNKYNKPMLYSNSCVNSFFDEPCNILYAQS